MLSRLFAICVFVSLTVPAIAAPLTPDVGINDARVDVFPKQPAQFPGGIVGMPDVEFANYVGFRPLLLDLYIHQDTKMASPLVIWIHGGGWDRGDSRDSGAFTDYPAVLAAIAARGYVVASVNYRLSGEARFPAAMIDVKAAIRFLRANASRYGIDPSRVYLWGGSAGGQLAALGATTCGIADFAPPPSSGRLTRAQMEKAVPLQVSDCVQGAMVWYGLFDLTRSVPDDGVGSAPVQTYLGCKSDCDALAAQASAIKFLSPSTPPMLIMCGTDDDLLNQSKEMVSRMQAMHLKVEAMYLAATGHGWIAKRPERTRTSTLEALQATMIYLDKLSGVKVD